MISQNVKSEKVVLSIQRIVVVMKAAQKSILTRCAGFSYVFMSSYRMTGFLYYTFQHNNI